MESDIDLEGIGLPIANEANKLLDEDVRKQQKDISRLQAQIDEHKDRVQTIRDHLINVRQELQLTQVGVSERGFARAPRLRLNSDLCMCTGTARCSQERCQDGKPFDTSL